MSLFNSIHNFLHQLMPIIFSDVSISIATVLEILVFCIKLFAVRRIPLGIRFVTLLIDEPMNFMSIALGYISALIVVKKNSDLRFFIILIAIIIGMLAINYLNDLIQENLQNRPKKIAIPLCSVYTIASYIIPVFELVIFQRI